MTATALPSQLAPIEIKSLTPLRDHVLVEDMQFKERFTNSGIFIPSDDGKLQGIHPRWGRVYAVGPDQKDIVAGQYVCVAHGRWTRGIKIKDTTGEHELRRIDVNDVLLVSDEEVIDENMGKPL